MKILVYRFGLLPPTTNAEAVREQMRLANRYKNDLVSLERPRRAKSRELELKAGDMEALKRAVDEAKAEVVEATRALKAARSSTRSRSETQGMRDRAATSRAALKLARARWSEARRRPKDPEIIESFGAIKRETGKAGNAIYRDTYKPLGLYWGTRAVVDEAIKAASKEPLYADGEPCDPAFRRWDGTGRLGIQVHQKGTGGKGLSVAEFMSGTGDAGAWLYSSSRGDGPTTPAKSPAVEAARARNAARRAAALAAGGGNTTERRCLHMRIGTDAEGEPIFASWPMVMHRPLPPAAILKRAVVHCRKIGPRPEWSCTLTVAVEGPLKAPAPADGGVVAVDIGWLAVPGGVQVARTLDAKGLSRTLVIDLGGLRFADELRGTRERNFNVARAEFVAWLRDHDMPEWMRLRTVKRGTACPSKAQALAYIESWKSPGKLRSLARGWRENRFEGDAAAFEALEAWRYHDVHLWHYEASQRKKAERRRQDTYRKFAASLGSAYTKLVVTDAKYDELARRPRAEAKPTNDTATKNRQGVAPGALRLELEQAFTSRGGEAERVTCKGLSITCPACGSCEPSQKDEAAHAIDCLSCNASFDLDEAMCLNILKTASDPTVVDGIIERRKRLGELLRGKGQHAAE